MLLLLLILVNCMRARALATLVLISLSDFLSAEMVALGNLSNSPSVETPWLDVSETLPVAIVLSVSVLTSII